MRRSRVAIAQSVQARLLNHARIMGVDPNLVFTRYGTERLLYRLSRSPHADRFVLKGALLLLVWLGDKIRPTRDADLLGFGDLSDDALAALFAEVCAIGVEDDGLTFDPASIRVSDIRPGDAYGGRRLTLLAHLGRARLNLQVDVGIGDAVVPEPDWIEYPSLLDLPRPRLRAYRPETAIAEKVHAMVVLGLRNSRMRDFFDIHALAQSRAFEGQTLAMAIRSTFGRRGTEIPRKLPAALTRAFAEEPGKQAQWTSFLMKNRLDDTPEDLARILAELADFLGPILTAAAIDELIRRHWAPGGPWSEGDVE